VNAAAIDLHPEVVEFLTRVREHLADLTQEERDELLDGLEADLSEQLSEGGAAALPDPASYAAELRSAAGLPAAGARSATKVRASTLGAHLVAAPDRLRAQWLRLAQRNDASRRVWSLLVAVRPAWWVLRAWVAVTFLDVLAGDSEYVTLVPSLGVALLGPAVLVAAIVVSVLIGQGKVWPGSGPDRPLVARLALAGLNVFAILLPLSFTVPVAQPYVYVGGDGYGSGYHDGTHRPGLRIGGDVVRNIYAYDADGRPLQGVQLFDHKGRPVAVSPVSSMGQGRDRQVTCPWFNGATPLFNVFPLAQRTQPRGTCLTDTDPAKVGAQGYHEPPLASVPAATLPAAPQE
jgi:hypothetical protein